MRAKQEDRKRNDRLRQKQEEKRRNDRLRQRQENRKRNDRLRQKQQSAGNVNRRKKAEKAEEQMRQKEGRRGNSQILILTYSVVLIFMGMVGYFVYFMVTQSQQVINNPYNKRQEVLAKKVQRGEILSADGKTLAKTVTDKDGTDTRVYPYNKIFCHVVGRTKNSMTGIEKTQCYPLLTSHSNPIKQLTNTFRGEKNKGDTVVTTLDAQLQKTAYNALGSHKGAVVALEPSTGKILAMVSKPAYNPNTVEKNWEQLVKNSDEESALVNRATQGLYPPGSTFKLMTAMEYMIENPDEYQDFRYQCSGSESFSGNVINCYGKERHGRLSLKSALAKSCNGAFAKIGTQLDLTSYRKLTEKFMFNKKLDVDFEYNQSKFSLDKKSDTGEVTQTVIGQGKTMITPLENALITATIANDGVMMKPYVVDYLENDDQKTVTSYEPESQGRIVDEWVAQKMTNLMKAVVTDGTGSSLRSLPYSVAGKTGSAEFDSEGTSHAWFVGFAPADNPKIVVSIVVEGAGTGSQYAVPIARQMFSNYLD
ncbi:MAG: penicillin-binding transpeptidase domain-containing protein [Butyribacter sp.]|nr:penicillin-binding transpeptidase domain-containing protein [bacterium]MDY3854927.1 penicillin-binding transpeptidase domain-containing protein [Butyribacter sp.]